jgi:hypothetical protein
LLASVISHELFLRRTNVPINHVWARKTNHGLDREAQLFAMPYTVYLPRGGVRVKEMRQPLEGEAKYSFQGMSLSVLSQLNMKIYTAA